MTEFEYDRIWKEMRETLQSIPKYYNMGYDLTKKHCEAGNGNKIALYWEDSDGNLEKYTYHELNDLSNRFANLLVGLGVGRGQRIFFRIPNIPEFYVGVLGIAKMGGVFIPSSTLFKEKEIAYRINDSQTVTVITIPELLPEVEAILPECPSVRDVIVIDRYAPEGFQLPDDIRFVEYDTAMAEQPRDFEIVNTRSYNLGFIAYTSGTTGDPKGVAHMQRYPAAYDYLSKYWHDFRPEDVATCPSEIGWMLPVSTTVMFALRHGLSVVFYNERGRFSAETWFGLMEKYRVSNFVGTPTMYRMFLKDRHADDYDLSAWRHGTSAGEALPPDTFHRVKEKWGVTLLDGIGMSEVMVNIHNIPGMPIKAGSCGRFGPGLHLNVMDDDGNPMLDETGLPLPGKAGEPGHLVIGRDHPGLMREYWNKSEKTFEVFKDEKWFWGGDVVYMDEDGYVFFQGRSDDVIKASGYRISPFEVESTLLEHPAVQEAAAVESPDKVRGNVVKAFLVLREGHEGSDELAKEIQAFFKERSGPYKYPRKIEFVRELPKTQSGKIKRKLLRAREFEGQERIGSVQ